MSAPPPVTFDCLVLSGGGFKGAYGAGAAKALAAYYQFKRVDRQVCYIGTSAGSLNAAVLAAYGPDRLIHFWRTVTEQEALGTRAGDFLRQCAVRLLQKWFTPKVPFSVYRNVELRKLISKSVRFEDVRDKHLVITATDYSGGQARAFYVSSLLDEFVRQDAQLETGRRRLAHCTPINDSETLVQALLASTAIPFFFPPVRIGSSWYIDGGVGNNTPTREAAYFLRFLKQTDRGSVGDVYCVKLAPRRIALDREPYLGPKDLLLRTYDVYDYIHMQAIIDAWYQINTNVRNHKAKADEFVKWLDSFQGKVDPAVTAQISERVQRDLSQLGGYTRRLEIPMMQVEPSAPLGGTLDFSPSKIKENIDLGYADMLKALSQNGRIDVLEHQVLANQRIY